MNVAQTAAGRRLLGFNEQNPWSLEKEVERRKELEEEEKEKQEEKRRKFNKNPWCQEKEDELIREDQELQLFTACEDGNKYIVKRLLLCNNLNLNCVGGSTGGRGMEQKKTKTPGATPLFKACQKNHIEVVTMLLLQSDRVDVNQATDFREQPKHGTPHTLFSTKIIRFLGQIQNGVFRQLQDY